VVHVPMPCATIPSVADEDTFRAAITAAEEQLAALSRAQEEARARLTALRESAGGRIAAPRQVALPIVTDVPLSPLATAADKIRLFRTLFRGRTDVFPKRWENTKQARSGYSPVCANEWVLGVCAKPRVKCGECPNQAFVSVDDRVIAFGHPVGGESDPPEALEQGGRK
jgi:hypothetical protein